MYIQNTSKYHLFREAILTEMARVGFVNNEYELYIHTDDAGKIPHFHLWDKATKGQEFHTCIKIICAEYFHHVGKTDVLNGKLQKVLVSFLRSKPTSSNRYDSYWELLIEMWNLNNSDVIVPIDTPMPDYTLLK